MHVGHLPQAPVQADDEVMEFGRRRRLARMGIGWVDAHLLAAALTFPSALWSLDRSLAAAARSLGVAFPGSGTG